jgi:hypothetical protein
MIFEFRSRLVHWRLSYASARNPSQSTPFSSERLTVWLRRKLPLEFALPFEQNHRLTGRLRLTPQSLKALVRSCPHSSE